MIATRMMPSRQIVQHGVRGVVHQIAAVEKRDDLHARRQNAARSAPSLSRESPSASNPTSAPLRSSTMPSTTSSLSIILPSSRWIALPNLAQPDLRTLRHRRDVVDAQRRAILGLDNGVLDVVDVRHQTDCPHVDLLQPFLDKAAAGVGVVVGELLLHLRDAQPVGDQLVGSMRT